LDKWWKFRNWKILPRWCRYTNSRFMFWWLVTPGTVYSTATEEYDGATWTAGGNLSVDIRSQQEQVYKLQHCLLVENFNRYY
jgi:hypothetical protein